MLAELLDRFIEQVATNNKDKVKMVRVANGAPGLVPVMAMNDDGVYEFDEIEYEMAPNHMKTKTLGSFMKSTEAVVGIEKIKDTRIFIGEKSIDAYLAETIEEVTETEYHRMGRVSLDLDHTDAFKFASTKQSMNPVQMKYAIMELFTGITNSESIEGSVPILSIVPLLSKVAVSEENRSTSENSKAEASVGLDVKRSLMMGSYGTDIPEMVTVPVRVYDQFDYLHFVRMLFRFDFESKKFILSPIQADIDEALDTTVSNITTALESIDIEDDNYTIIPASLVVNSGASEIR